jgi:hypothetical protein
VSFTGTVRDSAESAAQQKDLHRCRSSICWVVDWSPVRDMKIAQVAVGVSVIVIGLIPELYIQNRLHSHDWSPLDAPVTLRKGDVQTSEFSTDLDGTYIVSLAFDPNLVGDQLFKTACETVGSGLDLDWSVVGHSSGNDLALIQNRDYKPHAFGGSGAVQTELGSFEAQRGGRYKVLLKLRQDSSELNTASPRVRVDAARIYWETWVIYGQMALWLAGIVGLLGVFTIIWGLRI